MQFPTLLLCLLALVTNTAAVLVPSGAFVQWAFSVVGPGGPCITANSTQNGSPVIIQQCSAVPEENRSWFVPKGSAAQGIGPATQLKIFGDRCLDVIDGVDQNNVLLQIWECIDGNTNQQFNVNDQDLTISWAGKGKCVDLPDRNLASGTQLQIFTCSSTNGNQKWFPTVVEEPVLTAPVNQPVKVQPFIVSPRFAPCLTAASNANGAQVIIQNCSISASANHDWTVVKGGAPEGSGAGPASQVTIFGDKCLDVTDGNDANGVFLQIWTCAVGNTNQRFQFNGDGTVSWNGHNKCMDLTNGVLTDGNRIQLWDCVTNNINQAWNTVAP